MMDSIFSVGKYPCIDTNSITTPKNEWLFHGSNTSYINNHLHYFINNDEENIESISKNIREKLRLRQYKSAIDQNNYFFEPEVFHYNTNSLCLHDHINKLYILEILDKGRDASVYSVVLMHYAIRYSEIDHINEFFRLLDGHLLTSWSLIALLRSTSKYKAKIEAWKDLYYFTYSKVQDEGLNPERELYGLNRGL